MVEKFKKFFKKYGIFVSLAFVILILFILIFALLTRDKDDGIPKDGDDVTDTVPADIPPEFSTVRQPLSYHKNYEINFTTKVFNQLAQKEGRYKGFRIKDVNHLDWVENFVESIGKSHLEYSQGDAVTDRPSHYWENDDEWVTYDEIRDFLHAKFVLPIIVPEVEFNPRDEGSLARSLSNFSGEYFSPEFEYEIDDVSVEGNFFRVEFSRILEETPIHLELPREYMLFTPDGRLKEISILLAEFEEFTEIQYPLISAAELRDGINSMEYPKTVEFQILDPKVIDEYETHGYIAFTNPFKQKGSMEIAEMELVYFYVGVTQEVLVPNFLFQGAGLLDVEGDFVQSNFRVLASAIDPKYVYIHPDSHFEMLESLE